LSRHQTVYNTCGRNERIYAQNMPTNIHVILWLSVNLGVCCSLDTIGCYTRFPAHPIVKIMFHSWDQIRQLNCNFHYKYITAKLVFSCPFHYKNICNFTSLLTCVFIWLQLVIWHFTSNSVYFYLYFNPTCTTTFYFNKLIFNSTSPANLNVTLTNFIPLLTEIPFFSPRLYGLTPDLR
jgi:hypothetical protein